MPFKSEKQRRYLWAKHPEIAKRWAHEYPNKQKLPPYVRDKSTKQSGVFNMAQNLTRAPNAQNTTTPAVSYVFPAGLRDFLKQSRSETLRVPIPQNPKPTYAGQKQEEPAAPANATNCATNGDQTAAKTLLSKLAVVISPRILKEIEERKALAEARKAQYVPHNVNLRQYAISQNSMIPPPMGMAPPPPPTPPQASPPQPAQPQQTLPPVGGGSHPMANPINSFGALSSTGNINGNAAFGAKNSPDSSKIAAVISKWAAASPNTPCSCGCGDTVATCKCAADCQCWKPGGSCYTGEKKAGTPAWQRSEGKNDEGGLNAKGRASYNKATGGNLKAPVTESNPKGKRAKRQNSFCSRMCGMKRVNTGSKTKKDPDSRINKSLRKWNCKCGTDKLAASWQDGGYDWDDKPARDGLSAINDYARESFRNVDPQMIRPAAILATLGGLGTGMYLNHRLNRQLRQLKKAKRPEHRKILEHFRLKDMPLIQYPKLDNAAYVEQGAFEPGLFSKGLHVDDPVISAAIAKKPAMLEKAKKHGLVIYDGKFNTPAIMAHEAGHADIGNMPWYSPSRINQSYLRDLAGIVGWAAPMLGGAAGVLTRNPVLGVGAGALAGAALNAPTLINEWQATHRANKYLDEKMISNAERAKSKKTLNTAFNTYLAGAAVPAAIMGGLGGMAYTYR